MNLFRKLALATAIVAAPTAAWATGVLAISAAVKVPATVAMPAHVKVTATCVQGAGPVKVFFKETTSGTATKVFQSQGVCGAKAATLGQTVTIPVTAVPPGTYLIILKQGSSAFSAPFGPITLP
jgi:hypothetical protein